MKGHGYTCSLTAFSVNSENTLKLQSEDSVELKMPIQRVASQRGNGQATEVTDPPLKELTVLMVHSSAPGDCSEHRVGKSEPEYSLRMEGQAPRGTDHVFNNVCITLFKERP